MKKARVQLDNNKLRRLYLGANRVILRDSSITPIVYQNTSSQYCPPILVSLYNFWSWC